MTSLPGWRSRGGRARLTRHDGIGTRALTRNGILMECFFAHLGGCEGRLVQAHLIPKQRIRREVLHLLPHDVEAHTVLWDPRCWAWMCGGISKLGGHHGAFDAKQIDLHRDDLPEGLEEFAAEYGLTWSLEADYGLPSNFYDGAMDVPPLSNRWAKLEENK